jgi:hypothetical protein
VVSRIRADKNLYMVVTYGANQLLVEPELAVLLMCAWNSASVIGLTGAGLRSMTVMHSRSIQSLSDFFTR